MLATLASNCRILQRSAVVLYQRVSIVMGTWKGLPSRGCFWCSTATADTRGIGAGYPLQRVIRTENPSVLGQRCFGALTKKAHLEARNMGAVFTHHEWVAPELLMLRSTPLCEQAAELWMLCYQSG